MQRVLCFLFTALFFLSSFAQEEKVYTFRSEVRVDTSGYISVREDVRVYVKGVIFKRGITRALPLIRSDKDGDKVPVDYDIESVKRDGEPESFLPNGKGVTG